MSILFNTMKRLLAEANDNDYEYDMSDPEHPGWNEDNWWEQPERVANLPINKIHDTDDLDRYGEEDKFHGDSDEESLFNSHPDIHPGHFFRPYQNKIPLAPIYSPAHRILSNPDQTPNALRKLVDFAHEAYYDPSLQKTFGTNAKQLESAINRYTHSGYHGKLGEIKPEHIAHLLHLPIDEQDAMTIFYNQHHKLPPEITNKLTHFLGNKSHGNPTTNSTSPLIAPEPSSDSPYAQEKIEIDPNKISQIPHKLVHHIITNAKDPDSIAPIAFHHSNIPHKDWRHLIKRNDIADFRTSSALSWPHILEKNPNVPTDILKRLLLKYGPQTDLENQYSPHPYGDMLDAINKHPNGNEEIADIMHSIEPEYAIGNKHLGTEKVDSFFKTHMNSPKQIGKLSDVTVQDAIQHPNQSSESMIGTINQGHTMPRLLTHFAGKDTPNPEEVNNHLFDTIHPWIGHKESKEKKDAASVNWHNLLNTFANGKGKVSLAKRFIDSPHATHYTSPTMTRAMIHTPDLPKSYIKKLAHKTRHEPFAMNGVDVQDLLANAPEE